MPIKYIKIPSAIKIVDLDSGKPIHNYSPEGKDLGEVPAVTFGEFVKKAVLAANPTWTHGYDKLCSARTIDKLVSENLDGVIQMPEEDWRNLVEAIKNPQVAAPMGSRPGFGGWIPPVILQFGPFFDAIMKAGDSKE